MDHILPLLGWATFGLAIVVGLVLDMVGLFGNWILLAAMTSVWLLTHFEHFSAPSIALMLVLALAGEGLEMLASGYGARRFGGSKGAMVSALIGCLVGAVLGTPWMPIVGTLLGACVGAFAGAAAYEFVVLRKDPSAALWTGVGAALGRVAGLFARFIMGLAILLVAAIAF